MVDTVIKLFPSYENDFSSNGIGALSDTVSCTVREERNGSFELEMEYPVTGAYYDSIELRSIIVAKPNPYDDPQPFRIYSMEKPINGIITINAAHLSYDLSGYPVSPFSADGIATALRGLVANCPIECPFYFSTDKTTAAKYNLKTPSSIRNQLGGVEGSILDVYGGEYEFNGWNVILHDERGENRGVEISYGKNLTDFVQTEEGDKLYTGIYPFWHMDASEGMDEALVSLPEKFIYVDGDFGYDNILVVDFSDTFQSAPTESQLRSAANAYIKNNKIGIPKISFKLSFYPLTNSEEYSDLALLETVRLCDTVTINYPLYGIKAESKCISTEYNVLDGKYKSIELGTPTANLADKIYTQEETINAVVTKNEVDRAIDNATRYITGGSGGYVVMRSSTGGKEPDEILVMDAPDYRLATKIWRWNKNGLGFSSTGYNGPYGLAMTIDGQIVADFITTGTLQAERLQAGSITRTYLSNDVASFIQNGELWLNFDASSGGLIIGRAGSPFNVEITDTAIFFNEGSAAIASITNQKIEITDARFFNTLQLGKKESPYQYAFIPRSNGTLDFKYIGETI